MVNVKKAETADELAQCYNLRYQILRKPWQQPRGSETDGKEHECITALALDENENPIGTGRLQMNTSDEAQIRYMAVADVQQGRGVGSELLLFLENEARQLGAKNMVLNARENAIPFYLKHGYTITAEAETLWGLIPHKKMEKELKEMEINPKNPRPKFLLGFFLGITPMLFVFLTIKLLDLQTAYLGSLMLVIVLGFVLTSQNKLGLKAIGKGFLISAIFAFLVLMVLLVYAVTCLLGPRFH